MKVAYLAFDTHSLASLSVLSNYFTQIDYYLVNLQAPAQSIDIEKIPIMVDTVVIPFEQQFQTKMHKNILKKISRELHFYKNQLIIPGLKKEALAKVEYQKKSPSDVNSITEIKDIAFNSKTNQVFIEKDKTGVTAYNLLLIEDHQILNDHFIRFSKNLFKTLPRNSHVWMTIEFEFENKKPNTTDLGLKQFIFINDYLNETILDNWYFMRLDSQTISVQQWVPINQYKNSDYQKFMIARVEDMIKEKLEMIHIKRFLKYDVNTAIGFSLGKASLRNKRLSALMTSFNFCTQEEMNQSIVSKIDLKMKERNKMNNQPQITRG